MVTQLRLRDVTIELVQKDIKHVHLSVYPPTGRVRIAAPTRMSLAAIRAFAVSRLGWIRQQQTKLREQERETPREYLDRESHYVWGRRRLLRVFEIDEPPSIELKHSSINLRVRPGTDSRKRRALIEAWYREQLREALPPLLARWQPVLGVTVKRVFVQVMRTRWGSCNPTACSIRLNSELAKKPPECLEYVVLHELIHFLEWNHNGRFRAHMDEFMPQWRLHRDELNRAPLRHETWSY